MILAAGLLDVSDRRNLLRTYFFQANGIFRPLESPATSVPSSKPAAKQAPINKPPGKRGRPKHAIPAQEFVEETTGVVVQEAEWEDGELGEPETDDERQFWLMKAEPESRIEVSGPIAPATAMGRSLPCYYSQCFPTVIRHS